MRRLPSSCLLLLVAGLLTLVAASGTGAASAEKIKIREDLLPCFPLSDDEAGGKAVLEEGFAADRLVDASAKVEVWGVPREVLGQILDVVVRFEEGDPDRPIVIGRLYADPEDGGGRLSAALDPSELPPGAGDPVFDVVEPRTLRLLYASDPGDCSRA